MVDNPVEAKPKYAGRPSPIKLADDNRWKVLRCVCDTVLCRYSIDMIGTIEVQCRRCGKYTVKSVEMAHALGLAGTPEPDAMITP